MFEMNTFGTKIIEIIFKWNTKLFRQNGTLSIYVTGYGKMMGWLGIDDWFPSVYT